MNPQRYRFVVRSAEEAVKLIHERLGETARVVEVKQVEGKGLTRFLSSPRLEITAEVPAAAEPAAATAPPAPVASAPVVPEPAPVAAEPEPRGEESLLTRLIRSAGISGTVLARLQAHESWPAIARLPTGRALARVAALLSAQLQEQPRRPLGNRIVFLGSPGSGKTTALCKLLAAEVFMRQQRGAVLKLDLDSANPGDGLSVFCDAMGVPCARTVADVPELDAATLLFVDLPGVSFDDHDQVARLAEEITPLGPTSHVLVINAAYDAEILKQLCRTGEQIGCTHLVLTHCDELIHWGKLWDVLLGSALTPLFLGTGQNVAGDLEENVVAAILARTFPMLGKEAAKEVVAS
jgi:flagellar biosynthesis protein FlhF